jgi:predicted TIM-barrel fold metal-dependent hydrolase
MRAIDCWVNVNMSALGRPDYLTQVAANYFKQGEDFFRDYSVAEILQTMDALGIEKAILTTDPDRPSEHVLGFAAARPDRFFLGAQLDPRRAMKAVRSLERFHREQPNLVLARITPFYFDLPPNHALYYPIYTKCVELSLPISINTGIPGPPAPGECQHPMHLDRVCLHFPDLQLVMAHGADPWWSEACRLMLKYPNLSMMTSAYLPKYFPPELIHFMNTRGRSKIMFASDHPAIQMERCFKEALALDLREGVLEAFLVDNAERVFFSKRRAA